LSIPMSAPQPGRKLVAATKKSARARPERMFPPFVRGTIYRQRATYPRFFAIAHS
jgi:hypothetical protein